MQTVFEDGDVLVAATGTGTAIWTRLSGRWFNNMAGPTTATDESLIRNLQRENTPDRCNWHYVGNLYKEVPWDKVDHFTADFWSD